MNTLDTGHVEPGATAPEVESAADSRATGTIVRRVYSRYGTNDGLNFKGNAMHTPSRLSTIACAGSMLLASVALSAAQTAGGGGSAGNDSNNPAVIQGGVAPAMPNDGTMKDENGMLKNDNTGAVAKPGKECGQRGENQGTSQPDAKVACE